MKPAKPGRKAPERVTVPFVKRAKGGAKLVTVTAYDAPTGAILDAAGVDIVLVGDSVANVLLGYDTTLPVTMDEMLHHVRAVRRGVRRALVVGDMPFLSYQATPGDAIRNAGRFIKAGADAVKLEGGKEMEGTIRAMVDRGIPVMGHVGLTPQKVREFGGYRSRGRDLAEALRILEGARAIAEAGAFSMVLESIPASLARVVTQAVPVPTIGIGAGPMTDGQVLVFHDLVGLTPDPPWFVRQYARGHADFLGAVGRFARDVRRGKFPPSGRGPKLAPEDLRELALRAAVARVPRRHR
jgi:3-methyl-2-oxobutanoate hydroxymethyltransferase